MNYLENEFDKIKVEVFGESNIMYTVQNLLLLLTVHFNEKIIGIDELKNYNLGYPDNFSTIEDFSEGFLNSDDNYLTLINDASSENNYLDEENRKYNLLIVSIKDDKIKEYYYNAFYEHDNMLQYVVEKFRMQI